MKRLACYFVVVSVFLISVMPTVAFAASTTVQLYKDQTSVVSGAVGLNKTGKATTLNDSDSLFSVYGNLQYSAPGGGWSQKASVLVSRGNAGSCTNTQGTSGSWRMEINPYGWLTSGCRAHGTVTGS